MTEINFEQHERDRVKPKSIDGKKETIHSLSAKMVSQLMSNSRLQKILGLLLSYIIISGLISIFTSKLSFVVLCSLIIVVLVEDKLEIIKNIKQWMQKNKRNHH